MSLDKYSYLVYDGGAPEYAHLVRYKTGPDGYPDHSTYQWLVQNGTKWIDVSDEMAESLFRGHEWDVVPLNKVAAEIAARRRENS